MDGEISGSEGGQGEWGYDLDSHSDLPCPSLSILSSLTDCSRSGPHLYKLDLT